MTVAPYDFPKAHDRDINSGIGVAFSSSNHGDTWKATTLRVRNSYCTGWWPRDYTASPYDSSTVLSFSNTAVDMDVGQIHVYDDSTFDLSGGLIRSGVTLFDEGQLDIHGSDFYVDDNFVMALPETVALPSPLSKPLNIRGTLASGQAFDFNVYVRSANAGIGLSS